jgi:hypothetical protein
MLPSFLWDKRMAFPGAPRPSVSIEDESWRREHGEQMALHLGQTLTPAARIRAV